MPYCSAAQTPGYPQDWLLKEQPLPSCLGCTPRLGVSLPLLNHQLSPLSDKGWHLQTYYLGFSLNSPSSAFSLLICFGCRWFEFLLKYLILSFPKSKWLNILEKFKHLLNSVLLSSSLFFLLDIPAIFACLIFTSVNHFLFQNLFLMMVMVVSDDDYRCVHGRGHMCPGLCVGRLVLSTFVWAPGIKLGPPGLHCKYLYLLSQLASPRLAFLSQ